MTRLSEVLAAARAENRAALIGYLPAGYPSADGSAAAARAMVEGGCDVIEIGLPYSDPQMDGPVIQRAVEHALARGTNTHDVIANARAVAETGAAALVMSYWNPIERYGVDRFAEELAAAGGAGVITPDLIPDEAADWIAATDKHGLDRVFLVAPSSTDARLRLTTDACGGFVYAASTMGITGTRATVGERAAELVARTRKATDLPICVGLGVSTPAQAAEIAAYADGVIVGSAFVRALLDAETEQAGIDAVRTLAAALAEGVRAGR
ncbi:MAG TPA: tryptophan synthase subunit alpha [Yinghuangia sp.]|uniref:tryptophan synthase subunit alpha n=1 Tax=Yinghuangia sp. YIM S10712 TaxID=3436930 RepID=UPI002C52512B|nr:tryptophan synthase subunit alpha [Yinghuangia sp.]